MYFVEAKVIRTQQREVGHTRLFSMSKVLYFDEWNRTASIRVDFVSCLRCNTKHSTINACGRILWPPGWKNQQGSPLLCSGCSVPFARPTSASNRNGSHSDPFLLSLTDCGRTKIPAGASKQMADEPGSHFGRISKNAPSGDFDFVYDWRLAGNGINICRHIFMFEREFFCRCQI